MDLCGARPGSGALSLLPPLEHAQGAGSSTAAAALGGGTAGGPQLLQQGGPSFCPKGAAGNASGPRHKEARGFSGSMPAAHLVVGWV